MFNSNLGPNYAPLQDIRLQNMCDLEFDLSRSLKVKSNGAVGLPTYDFLLVSNSNYMSISQRLGVIATRKIFSYLLSLGPNFDKNMLCKAMAGFNKYQQTKSMCLES